MPIWRKLHVKSTDSLDINDMPDDFTRLMWVLLPLKLCREGRGIDMPQWIASQLFPLRSDVALEQVESAMRWYQDRRMITRYLVRGRPYFEVNSWHDYQGTTTREATSPYPSQEEVDEDIDIDVDIDASRKTYSRVSPELVQTDSNRPKTPFMPVHLASPEMLNSWGEWLQHQKDRTGRELSTGTRLKQFKRIEEIGVARAIAAIEYSIESNYQRLVEPKRQSPNGQQAEPAGFDAIREVMEEINNGNT